MKQRGITLIALIITIIVMLIMVGVTINAVLNGGVINKARVSAVETERQSIYEQILSMAVWNNDGTIDVPKTVEEIAKHFTINPSSVANGTTSTTITVSGKHGEYKYKIDKNGISIVIVKGEKSLLDELKEKLIGYNFTNDDIDSLFESLGITPDFDNSPESGLKVGYKGKDFVLIYDKDDNITDVIYYEGTPEITEVMQDSTGTFRIELYDPKDGSEIYAIITGFGEEGENYLSTNNGSLVIPETLTYKDKTYSVKQIGDGAFRKCTQITELTLNEGLISIQSSAFQECSGITNTLTIPSSVTTIGASAFQECSGITNTLTIPSSVTTIGYAAFNECSNITGLTLNEGLLSIGANAFKNASALAGDLEIPITVTTIGSDAFSSTDLNSISVSRNIEGKPWGASSTTEISYIEPSPWIERELSSENVVFDKEYVGDIGVFEDQSITIYDDGRIKGGWNSLSNETIESYISATSGKKIEIVDTNTIYLLDPTASDTSWMFMFEANETVKVSSCKHSKYDTYDKLKAELQRIMAGGTGSGMSILQVEN